MYLSCKVQPNIRIFDQANDVKFAFISEFTLVGSFLAYNTRVDTIVYEQNCTVKGTMANRQVRLHRNSLEYLCHYFGDHVILSTFMSSISVAAHTPLFIKSSVMYH